MKWTELPATHTDLLVRPAGSIVIEHADYISVQTPERPDYWYGNRLIMRSAARKEGVGQWLKLWNREFDRSPRVQKIVIEWETPGAVDRSADEQTALEGRRIGLSFDRSTVLVLKHPAPSLSMSQWTPRRALCDADWKAVADIQAIEMGEGSAEMEAFWHWRVREYRSLAMTGRGAWWGIWDAGSLCGSAGVFWDNGWVRFQSVVTAARFRRRGICTALISGMLAAPRRRLSSEKVIIVTEEGSDAERIYQRLGFQPVGHQYALAGDRTLATT
jgi:GNAT superfamily N-acetyltransferase